MNIISIDEIVDSEVLDFDPSTNVVRIYESGMVMSYQIQRTYEDERIIYNPQRKVFDPVEDYPLF